MKENIKKFVGSNVRHWLTLGAGALVAKGYLDVESANSAAEGISSGVTELIVGGVLFLLGQGWSLFDKFAGKKLAPKELVEAADEVESKDDAEPKED